MKRTMTEKELLDRIAGLPRAFGPERDAWPSIQAHIERSGAAADRTPRRPRWLASAAVAAGLAVVAAFWVADRISTRAPSAPQHFADSAGPATGPLPLSEVEYLAAFREYIGIGSARGRLSSGTIETIEMGWTDLLQAELALAKAIEADPDNRFLNERLRELRGRQLDFLRQLATLDRNNRRFNT
jgi:hypothetical protein